MEIRTLVQAHTTLDKALAAIGIDRDGMIVVANRMAQQIFSADGAGYSLLGETAGTVLPADLLAWLWSGLHQRDEDAKAFSVAGSDVRCWCRLLGEFSRSRGILLVMDTQPCSERLAGSHACDL